MLRRLFTVLSVVSLLLCVATYVLWVRSAKTSDHIFWSKWEPAEKDDCAFYRRTVCELDSAEGVLTLSVQVDRVELELYQNPGIFIDGAQNGWHRWAEPIFHGSRITGYWGIRADRPPREVRFPHWLVSAAATILPMTWLAGRLRTMRHRHPGLCPASGYDVRATPGRCPECGEAPASA